MKGLHNKMIPMTVLALGIMITACTRDQVSDINENLVPRLSLNINALTGMTSEGFYNRGSGFDLPGSPVGDSVIAYNSRGLSPIGGFSMVFQNGTHPSSTTRIRGLNTIQHIATREFPNDYTVWRPIELNVPPRRTSVIMNISVSSASTVDIVFGNRQASLRRGFRTHEDDIAVISISQGAIWARKLGESLDTHYSQRVGDFYSASPYSAQNLHLLSLTFNAETNTCKLALGATINKNLDAEYCNPTDTSKIVVGMRTFKTFRSPNYRVPPSYSISSMNVISFK